MRIALIVLWWVAVALSIVHSLLSVNSYSGIDFYLHGIVSVLIISAGPIGLHAKVPVLFYGGYLTLVIEFLWKATFVSEYMKFSNGNLFSDSIMTIWIITLLVISVILILATIQISKPEGPLNLKEHLTSNFRIPVQVVRNSTVITLGLMGLFIFFGLRMQGFTFIRQDWIKLAVFTTILVVWIVGVSTSRSSVLLCSFYFSFGAFLFYTPTAVSYTYSTITLAFQHDYSNILKSDYYHAFLTGGLYFLVSLPLLIRTAMALNTASISGSQQLDQF